MKRKILAVFMAFMVLLVPLHAFARTQTLPQTQTKPWYDRVFGNGLLVQEYGTLANWYQGFLTDMYNNENLVKGVGAWTLAGGDPISAVLSSSLLWNSGGGSGGGGSSSVNTNYGYNKYYNFNDSGATNNYLYNDNSYTNSYSVFNQFNNSFNYYNPITNNYTDITNNNLYYNPTYNTYYIQGGDTYNYNTYVTNNYTYVSYYIYDPVEEISWYYEIYYMLPDGRNSYNLEAEDVWGQYFFYDVVNYQEVAEDDGVTLALYHFDGNLFDSSAKSADPCTSTSTMFSDGHFSSAHYIKYNTTLKVPIPSDCYTIEFFIYLTSTTYSGQTTNVTYQPFSGFGLRYDLLRFVTDQWNHVAITKLGDKLINVWINGNLSQSNLSSSFPEIVSFSPYSSSYCYIDELRLSNKVLYTDTFTPSAQPFDTNSVLVVPETGSETTIAVKSNIPVNGLRVGGVRPTYPVNGYVYVYLEDNIVKDVQQYQNDGWYSVTASIYENGAWTPFNDKDVSTYEEPEPTPDDPDPTPTPGGDISTGETPGGGGTGGDDDDGGFWDFLTDLFGGLIDLLASLVGGAVKLLAGVLGGLVDLFKTLLSFVSGFTDFLTAAFAFLPADMLSALSAGIILMVIIAIIKFIGGFL